ncbi:serine/threonine-protein kinase [Alienimonas californiensis]|uniref:Serine/threonine-protein kinase PrkC n=1 Tax=Alienimonas californiensis TaxID=2527989 RepID=A0A517PCM1_9PLAN|nr:serine/threonine-protein kinase [Alienimonas californiensis]QDT17106.1 Serine/threonine-protein kinase PrkC [Alienimonas californiensis]
MTRAATPRPGRSQTSLVRAAGGILLSKDDDGGTHTVDAPPAPPWAAVSHTVLRPPPEERSGDSAATVLPESGGTLLDGADLRRRLFPAVGEADPALTGCVLDHFRIEQRIGHGGMGSVFKAVDERLQRTVALKVLSPAHSKDRASVLRFRNEARSAARLDHLNIARAFYVGEDRGLHFIAFEFVTGRTVRDLLETHGPLSPPDAVSITRQVAEALHHCAAAGVVHRDVKPSNVIVTPDGIVKLVDLGLARKEAADSVGDLTVAGTTLGTFDYIAPEQAKDPRVADVRSDLYSLGCTLFHMLTGRPPYPEGTVLQKLLDHQNPQTPDVRDFNAKVPAPLAALCKSMMASDPAQRPQTPEILLDELDDLPRVRGLRPRRQLRGVPLLNAVGTAALAAALVLIAWVRWPEERPTGYAYMPAPIAEANAAELASATTPPRPVEPTPAPPPVVPTPPAVDEEDEPRTVTSGANMPAVAARPAEPSRFEVGGDGAAPRGFSSLDAAVEDASRGEVVTINVDGPLDFVLKKPITLIGKTLTLRAGTRSDGTLYQPRLKAFANYQAPQSLIHLTGAADLTLENLSLSFDLPSRADGWTMFSVGAGDRLTMRDCTVTLNGAEERADANSLLLVRGYQQPSSLGELADPDRKERAADGEFYVTAERCLLRGQGDLVRVEPDRAGMLDFSHTAAAVQSAALRMGGANAEGPPPGEGAGRVHFKLQRSTMLFGEALLDLRWKAMLEERPPLPLTVFASDSLFVDAAGEGVLIRTRGGADQQEFLSRLEWTGAGTNRYLLDRFWIASGTTTEINNPADAFSDWQALAENSNSPVMDMGARHRGVELEPDYRGRFPNLISRQDVEPRSSQSAAVPPVDRDADPDSGGVPPAILDEPPPGVDVDRLPPTPGIRTAQP